MIACDYETAARRYDFRPRRAADAIIDIAHHAQNELACSFFTAIVFVTGSRDAAVSAMRDVIRRRGAPRHRR